MAMSIRLVSAILKIALKIGQKGLLSRVMQSFNGLTVSNTIVSIVLKHKKIHLCLTSAEFPVDLSIKAGQDFYVAHRTEIRLTEQYCDSHGEEYVKGEIALAIYPKSHLHVSGFKVKKQHLQLFADFLKDFIEKDYGDCEGECVYLAQDEQSIAELKAISENIREYKAAQREKRKNKEWWQFWI